MQILTHTSGDVSEALHWLNLLDNKYDLTDDNYGMGDFIQDLKDRGYIKDDDDQGPGNYIITAKSEQTIRKRSLEEIFGKLKRSRPGQHRTPFPGMMALNQMGLVRHRETPTEYAAATVDPALDTDFRKFMSLYQKMKYAPDGLAPDESDFLSRFKNEFSGKLFSAFPRQKIIASFLDFRRTLRFLFGRN